MDNIQGPLYGSADAHIQIARVALNMAATMLGVNAELAKELSDQIVTDFQASLAPHITARSFELLGLTKQL
jgi:hypothetical protein